MRLGELLIAAQVITPAQLEDALRAQVLLGARLGSILVELGYVDLDGIANALACQHRLPAALASHFARADHELQLRLSPSLAERLACVPLLRVGKRSAVVAVIAPLPPRAIAMIADELGYAADRVIIAIAPELRIRYTLEHVYQIPRAPRFLRAPGSPHAAPAKLALLDVAVPRLEEPIPEPIASRDSSERRRYLPTILDMEHEIAPIELDPEADLEEVTDSVASTVIEAIVSRRDRKEVASLSLDAIGRLEPGCDAAALLSMRGAVAVASATFRRDGGALPAIALPLDHAGAVERALRTRMVQRVGPDAPTDLDRRLLASLGVPGGTLVVAPLVVGTRAVAALVASGRRGLEVATVELIAGAAAAAFARLMREATE